MTRITLAVLMMCVAAQVGEIQQVDTSPSGHWISADQSARNQKEVMQYLSPFLAAENAAGRVYYQSACQPADEFPVPFPKPDLRSDVIANGLLQGPQELFRGRYDTTISQPTDGLIRIRIGHPPVSLLNTTISHLQFSWEEQYDPVLAIGAVLDNEDVRIVMRKSQFIPTTGILTGFFENPGPGVPHLPASGYSNVTAEEMFDVIAKTFNGTVLYGAVQCGDKTNFDMDFELVRSKLRQ